MKTFWVYVRAAIASMAWIFILLALCLALFDPTSDIHRDPAVAVIAIVLALGHLACGPYLVRGIHDNVRQANRQRSATHGRSDEGDRDLPSPS